MVQTTIMSISTFFIIYSVKLPTLHHIPWFQLFKTKIEKFNDHTKKRKLMKNQNPSSIDENPNWSKEQLGRPTGPNQKIIRRRRMGRRTPIGVFLFSNSTEGKEPRSPKNSRPFDL